MIPYAIRLRATVDERGALIKALLTGSALAANPLFGWRIDGVRRSDKVTVAWRDKLGQTQAKDTSAP